MKWLLILALAVGGCADDSPSPPPGGGSPIVPPGGFGGSGGTSGAGGAGGAGGIGGASRGACDNATDFAAIEAVSQNVREISANCGASLECASMIGSSEHYGQCVTGCVEEGVSGLSTECASCYGDLESCGLDAFCLNTCQIDGCGVPCLNCLSTAGCIEEFETCRGLPGDACPR